MRIFTFWEPRDKMPYYLQLCMETWRKYLPDAEIILLDRTNILDYVDLSIFDDNLFSGRFTLPQIADAMRVALLAKHGGIWLDVDTIILNSSVKKYFLPNAEYPVTFFGDTKSRICSICFINAAPNTRCMNLWLRFIQKRLNAVKPNTTIGWGYLGNRFIDDYAKDYPKDINIIPVDATMPELAAFGLDLNVKSNIHDRAYVEYYFIQQRHIEEVPADMIFLHNSWTPDDFINADKEIFLRCNFTMANVLMAALDMKRNLNEPQITFKLD